MERYVIVCLINGEALKFHEQLVNEVCNKFNVVPQRLPGHFTIKAPFEIEDIGEVEELTKSFCDQHLKSTIKLEGYGHFREDVIFMDIIPSEEAIKVHDEYIEQLEVINGLTWSKNEGKGRKFHCTVVSKRIREKYNDIWNYVKNYPCSFECYFDNISILIWDKNKRRWVTYRSYKLK